MEFQSLLFQMFAENCRWTHRWILSIPGHCLKREQYGTQLIMKIYCVALDVTGIQLYSALSIMTRGMTKNNSADVRIFKLIWIYNAESHEKLISWLVRWNINQITCKKQVPQHLLNSLWPSGTIWWHKSGSTLAQVIACCLTAPSHYLNQCWLIIGKVQWHSSECNFTRDTSAISHWKLFI